MSAISIQFKNGINNTARVERLPDGYVREMTNLNVDNSGIASSRFGFDKKVTGEVSTVWSDDDRCFMVLDGDLVELNEDYSTTVLYAGIGHSRLDFVSPNGRYYFVGEHASGIISGNSVVQFGQERVEYQPTLSAVPGGILKAGTYLVAVTLLDDSGMESGTVAPTSITLLSDDLAIQLSNLFRRRDTRSTYYAIYMSGRDGSELYRQGVIPVGTPTVSIYDVDVHGLPLNSLGFRPAPLGQLIAYHYSHLYIASGQYLYYSEKFIYERWKPENNYYYPSKITALCPCESGLWVGTEKNGLYWVSGRNPRHGTESSGDFGQAHKMHNSCPYIGSREFIPPEFIDGQTHGWMVTAADGLILLLDNGQFVNVSQKNVKLPSFASCASAIIRHFDSFNYLAIIKGLFDLNAAIGGTAVDPPTPPVTTCRTTRVHIQSVAAITWTVNHNLGYNPNVTLLTVDGIEFIGQISFPTLNQFVVTLNVAMAGEAFYD